MPINLQRLEDFPTRIRVLRQTLGRRFKDEAQRRDVETTIGRLEAFAEEQRRAIKSDIASGRFTEDGVRDEAAKRLQRARVSIEEIAKPQRERLASIQATKDKMARGLLVRTDSGYRDARPEERALSDEDRARHREIRDLMRQDIQRGHSFPFRANDDRYLAAVRAGDNPDLVRAVEDAPKGFELVSDLARKFALEARLQAFPEALAIMEPQEEEAKLVTELVADIDRSFQELGASTTTASPRNSDAEMRQRLRGQTPQQ